MSNFDEICQAAKAKDAEALKEVLKKTTIDEFKDGFTAAALLAHEGDVESSNFLISHGAKSVRRDKAECDKNWLSLWNEMRRLYEAEALSLASIFETGRVEDSQAKESEGSEPHFLYKIAELFKKYYRTEMDNAKLEWEAELAKKMLGNFYSFSLEMTKIKENFEQKPNELQQQVDLVLVQRELSQSKLEVARAELRATIAEGKVWRAEHETSQAKFEASEAKFETSQVKIKAEAAQAEFEAILQTERKTAKDQVEAAVAKMKAAEAQLEAEIAEHEATRKAIHKAEQEALQSKFAANQAQLKAEIVESKGVNAELDAMRSRSLSSTPINEEISSKLQELVVRTRKLCHFSNAKIRTWEQGIFRGSRSHQPELSNK